ncbi:MAG: Spy/CpxP family protein refolding chaperone [Pseudomonadota bacterium]
MTAAKPLAVSLLALAMAAPALAQQQMPQGQGQGQAPTAADQVSQLDDLVDLDDGQEQELETLLNDSQDRIKELQEDAREVQAQLEGSIGADFDEASIRQDAERLGQLTGDMMAESVLMQSRIEATLTQEQRDELERQMQEQQKQMEQMQRQMQEQQMQQQPSE